jgi:hypothetical protein
MKKDFVISRIEASQDGSPYVYVTLTDHSDYKAGAEHDGLYFSGRSDEKFTESNGNFI